MTQQVEPKVLVVQFGSRRQYDMPIALERAGMLAGLYTDLCGSAGIGKLVAPVARLLGGRFKKLAKRELPDEVAAKTRTFPSWTWDMEQAAREPSTADRARAYIEAHEAVGAKMQQAGFGDASHLLVIFMEAQGMLSAAKRQGLTTISDMVIALSAERIVREERRKHPGWEADGYFWGETLTEEDPSFRPSAETLAMTDIFLCPSTFVQDDLIENFGVPAKKTLLLPYTTNPMFLEIKPQTRKGQVFFAGEPGLRKGIHTLAEAARILRERGRDYDFRIAGHATQTVLARPEVSELTFLGRIPHDRMREELASADVFAFPSIAEGSAGVTYEAMGARVPVVTTKESGSVARDGVDGLIVPRGDPAALADAIEKIVEDRGLREAMAASAREKAREYSWDTFETRLPKALMDFAVREAIEPR
ncbi:glycosyltransferase family 4 protein [Erythrobacter alti]|uniref:glycosyltransferase family 4 protein n=1 Tax=Erythrobacter alti TaxID=1896145 RepID=UPI0030F37863